MVFRNGERAHHHYESEEDFETVLYRAGLRASTVFEWGFVSSAKKAYSAKGIRMEWSEAQNEILLAICGGRVCQCIASNQL